MSWVDQFTRGPRAGPGDEAGRIERSGDATAQVHNQIGEVQTLDPDRARNWPHWKGPGTLNWLLLLGIAILVLALALSLWLAIDSFLDEIEIVIEKADPPSGS